MERNIVQHRAFTPGFDQFYEYSRTCPAKEYDGQKIRSLIEAFADPLTQHLYDEIESLRALDKYDSERVRQAYKRLEKSLMATDNVRHTLNKEGVFLNVADSVLVSYRPPRFRDRRQDLRRWQA